MHGADGEVTVEEVPSTYTTHIQKKKLIENLRLGASTPAPSEPNVVVMGSHLPNMAAVATSGNYIVSTRHTDSKGRLSLNGLDQLGWQPGVLTVSTAGPWFELAPGQGDAQRNVCRLLSGERITLSKGVRRKTGDDVLVVADLEATRLFVAAASIVITLFTPHTTKELAHA